GLTRVGPPAPAQGGGPSQASMLNWGQSGYEIVDKPQWRPRRSTRRRHAFRCVGGLPAKAAMEAARIDAAQFPASDVANYEGEESASGHPLARRGRSHIRLSRCDSRLDKE